MKKVTIKYYFTEYCNFECEYCSRQLYKIQNPKIVSCAEIDKFISNIKHLKINTFKLFGAEPSTYDNFFYLLEKVKELDCECISIFTNGSNLDFYKKLLPYITDKIRIIVSIHLKYKDLFIDNLDFIKNNFNVKFSILLDKQYDVFLDEIFNKIKDRPYSFEPIYNGEERSIFDINNKFNNMKYVISVCKKYSYKLDTILNLDRNNKINHNCIVSSIAIRPDGSFYYSGCFKYYFNNSYNFYADEPYNHIFHKIKCDGKEYRLPNIYSCKEMCEYFLDKK